MKIRGYILKKRKVFEINDGFDGYYMARTFNQMIGIMSKIHGISKDELRKRFKDDGIDGFACETRRASKWW